MHIVQYPLLGYPFVALAFSCMLPGFQLLIISPVMDNLKVRNLWSNNFVPFATTSF